MSTTLVVNQEHSGLELYFTEKPTETILEELKAAHWRYHRVKKCWYAKQNTVNQQIADSIAESSASEAVCTAPSEAFFPPFDVVDGAQIYRSSEISCWEHDEGYFQDINAYVEVRVNRITIIDLTNALVPGRECERLVLEPEDEYQPESLHAGLATFRAVYDKYFVQRELPDCRVYKSKQKATRVFTPFKRIAPIRIPTKWTLPHVWKAILSGQIYQGWCDGRYTDDYAYDAAVDFRSGCGLHLPTFAKGLIEEPSGWYVHPDKAEGASITLSVNCYSFNTNTLLFDADCDWAENQRRRSQREQEKTRQNAELEAQLLSFDEVNRLAPKETLYDARYLRMNDNTNQYEVREGTFLREQLLGDDRLWYDVIHIAPHPIADDALYEIDCAQSFAETDERIIPTSDGMIVSGVALRELLTAHADSEKIASVALHHQTWEQLCKSLKDWRDGRIRNLLNPAPRELYVRAIERLNAEGSRITSLKSMEG